MEMQNSISLCADVAAAHGLGIAWQPAVLCVFVSFYMHISRTASSQKSELFIKYIFNPFTADFENKQTRRLSIWY